MSRLGHGDLAKAGASTRGGWTRENVGYCTFLLLKNPETAEKHATQPIREEKDRVRVERKTKRKLAATKEYINQNRRELWIYLYHRELRREAMELSIAKAGLTPESAMAVRNAHFDKESQYLRLRRVRTSLKEFTILARLGKGGYGQVYLCRKVDTGEILALKQMKKSRFTDKNEVHRVKKEREVMTKTNSIWLARLKYCFQSQHYLYMAMEYIPGGDLKTLLDHMTALDEVDAKFLFAEMLLAVDSLHQLGYIHRDLKPDNFMIDKNGHLKLIDFGLSKEGFSEKLNTSRSIKRRQSSFRVGAWKKNTLSIPLQTTKSRNKHRQVLSVVGSPEYMALEILNQDGYSQLVDYWSLGVILFEFIFGYTPFGADTVAGVFENVKNYRKRVVRPPKDEEDDESDEVSDDCWDLISRLITDCDARIGKGGISEVKMHPWFKGFDWDNIREMEPPFIPNLESENDTSYFPAEEPMVQSGLAELEADLDHLISKQLAHSTEGKSMEAVFDHRSGKHTVKNGDASAKPGTANLEKKPPSDNVLTAPSAVTVVPPTSPTPPAETPSHSKPNSRHNSKGRRGSSRRTESPAPISKPAPPIALTGNDSGGSGNDMPPLSAPTPPPTTMATTEHPKLKFNQSYSKFDFAGFTFKHEDFTILESGSPRDRERSNSTVELDPAQIAAIEATPNPISALPPVAINPTNESPNIPPRDRALTVRDTTVTTKSARGVSSTGHSPSGSPSNTDSILYASGAGAGSSSSPRGTGMNASGSSTSSNASATPKSAKDKLSQILGPEVHSTSTSKLGKGQTSFSPPVASPLASGAGPLSPTSSMTAMSPMSGTPGKSKRSHGSSSSSTGAGSPASFHGTHGFDQDYSSLEHPKMIGRTNTVQVLTPQDSFKSPLSSHDAVRHSDSATGTKISHKSKGSRDGGSSVSSGQGAGSSTASPEESLDGLKRRITRLKKQNTDPGETEDVVTSGTSSTGILSPGVRSSAAPVASAVPSTFSSGHNSDASSRGSGSDFEAREEGEFLGSSSGSLKKKKKDTPLRKIQGLFEKLNFGGKSSSSTTSDAASANSSSSLIVVNTKGSSTKVISPRGDRERSAAGGRDENSPRNLAHSDKASTMVPSSVKTRNRSGTAGNEEAAGITLMSDLPKRSTSESRHRSEGRVPHRSRHRDSPSAILPALTTQSVTGSASVESPLMSPPVTPSKSKKRSSGVRPAHPHTAHATATPVSARSPDSRGHSRNPSSEYYAAPASTDPLMAANIESLDPQARKERLLALARAFKENKGIASSPSSREPLLGTSSPPTSGYSATGSHSALSSGKSTPRAHSPMRTRDETPGSSESGSRRGSEKRLRRNSSGSSSRKRLASRQASAIDPVEEASNEQSPAPTPEKVDKTSPSLERDAKSPSEKESKHSRKRSKDKGEEKDKSKKTILSITVPLPEEPAISTPTSKRPKDKSTSKESKSAKPSKS